MRRRLAWALVTALAALDQVADPAKPLTLELRVFNGTDEVTAETARPSTGPAIAASR